MVDADAPSSPPKDDRDWPKAEWLEADRLGGFAMGTASAGIRTRRYHGLLAPAVRPPTGRVMLVNGVEAWLETLEGRVPLTSHRYGDGVVHPAGQASLIAYQATPWPRWIFRVRPPGASREARLTQELFVDPEAGETVLRFRLPVAALPWCRLTLRPLLSGRDYHALHRENPDFDFEPVGRVGAGNVAFRPYPGLPAVALLSNADGFRQDPLWFRSFVYDEERARGLDFEEDLASPGVFHWERSAAGTLLGDPAVAVLVLRPGDGLHADAAAHAEGLRRGEARRRAAFPSPLHQAADAYFVRRGGGLTVVAGYPWFTDWGRDTFIALRGLGLAGGRGRDAASVLLSWAEMVDGGRVPSRFPDRGEAPELNAVDASLWFVVVAGELLASTLGDVRAALAGGGRERLARGIHQVLAGFREGTRFGIREDPEDGLLACGEPGVQLTWMDAKVGDRVITPRIGKPVEVQALWINALAVGAALDPRLRGPVDRARSSFAERFWDPRRGYLADVVDVDHRPGAVDETLRPNQVLAAGGLPLTLVDGAVARAVVDRVEASLWTPLGLRSLDPAAPAYRGRYDGGVVSRDEAYHQGTVWPWLLGPFVEARLRVRGGLDEGPAAEAVRREGRHRFLSPLLAHLPEAGLGHVTEIADGEPPHRPRGAPFQAWSLGELLRIRGLLRATGDDTV